MRKKEWQAPELEVLDVRKTAAGWGHKIEDDWQNDPDDPDFWSAS
ncbi:paeninodin family lasso peptide [Thermobacillus sp. ZCTH02-B1]|nr:paeninodin family lasso peptide [Thermobacillus sp. ZCTH02-B1]